ncbi:hypothetical protein [Methanoregula sp.]|uniref:hypothetical protein n=1 Tax=Methanoregula sp. TaxID=2052170 RepID=UPI003C5BC4BF
MAKISNELAVSPIVATLVLIVVAVIGAVAVGTIMGTFSTQVSKQASASQAASASQDEIIVAGTWYGVPAEQNLATDFERLNPGTQVNVQSGGSGEAPMAIAMSVADIGTVANSMQITTAQTTHPTDPMYQNLYFTQLGGRGIVFIQDQSGLAVPNNIVAPSDLNTLYSNVAGDGTEKGVANNFSVTTNITVEQFPAQRFPNVVVFSLAGLPAYEVNNNVPNAVTNYDEPAMLASVRAGSAAHPAFGFIDAGYAITGGIASNTTATGIKIVGIATSTGTYIPTHTNIRNALHDWEYGYAQDTTSGPNYPQGLLGGFYWITRGSSPSALTGNRVTTPGISAASSEVTGFINFAKSPSEATAWNNGGVYSMYDFM